MLGMPLDWLWHEGVGDGMLKTGICNIVRVREQLTF